MPLIAEMLVPESSVDSIEAAASGLAASSTVELREHPEIPDLYDAAARGLVAYQREDPELQTWWPPSRVLERGHGDCKHFSAWRVADLRRAGRKAMVKVIDRRDPEHPGRFHAVVEHVNGDVEDPSKIVIALGQQGAYAAPQGATMRTEFKVRRNAQGPGYVAGVSVPVHRQHRLALACVGDTRAEALDKATGLALQLANDPVLLALLPPQAVAAIIGVKEIARAARAGVLDQVVDQIVGPSKQAIAKALAREHRDLLGAASSVPCTRDGMKVQCDPRCVSSSGASLTNEDCTRGAYTAQFDRFGQRITKPSGKSKPPAKALPPKGSPTRVAPPAIDPATGNPVGYVRDESTGGWRRPTVTEAQQADAAAMDPAGYYDPTNPQGYAAGWPPPTPNYPYDYDPNNPPQQGVPGGWDDPWAGMYGGGYDPFAQAPSPNYGAGIDAWGQQLDPYLFPGQVPFAPGWSPYAPSARTSTYPPPFEGGGGGVAVPGAGSSAWYSQPGAEAMFAQGAWYPDQSWVDEFNPGESFMSDVADVADVSNVSDLANVAEPRALDDLAAAGGDPWRAELVACARGAGWDTSSDVADVADVADVE